MNIKFYKLTKSDFDLLLNWHEESHVKEWYDTQIIYTKELIEEKYTDYLRNFKIEDNQKKEIFSYVFSIDNIKIGYIQYYNPYDFQRLTPLINMPDKMAAFDMFIGDPNYIKKGIGPFVLNKFFNEIIDAKYNYLFADTNSENVGAIKSYLKIGFEIIKNDLETKEVHMIKKREQGR